MLCLVFLMLLLTKIWAQFPQNPCPSIFEYKSSNGVTYGEINIPYDGSKEMDLQVNVSIPGLHKNAKLEIKLETPTGKILSSSYLKYRLDFPSRADIPKITKITYNNEMYCSGPDEPLNSKGVTNIWANMIYIISKYTYTTQINQNASIPFFFQNQNNSQYNFSATTEQVVVQPSTTILDQVSQTDFRSSSELPPSSVLSDNKCGISNNNILHNLVVSGQQTSKDEFPWLAAMYYVTGNTYAFKCTANLISNRYVVTAAHCVWYLKAPRIRKEDILLVFGTSDISHWATAPGALSVGVQEVIPHPEYRESSGHGDIAIIKLIKDIKFTESIRPICLWTFESDVKKIIGVKGVVAGWGKTSVTSTLASNNPYKINIPVVSQFDCLQSHQTFLNLTSSKTFCAGYKNGSGPCSGDSGSPFMVHKNNQWFLRGIVSQSIKDENGSCDLNHYVVFADVAIFKEWILNEIN